MTTVSMEDYLLKLDKILLKTKDFITLKDITSLIFYAIHNLKKNSKNSEEPCVHKWSEIYEQFEDDLQQQNTQGWPKLNINRNNYDKRVDITFTDHYICTENILSLLLRLLYIEKYKRAYVYKSDEYYPILGYFINIVSSKGTDKHISEFSLEELFKILETGLIYYLDIYNDETRLEYQIGKNILNQIQ